MRLNSEQSAVGSRQSAVNSRQSAVNSRQSAVNSRQSAVNSRQSSVNRRQSTAGIIIGALFAFGGALAAQQYTFEQVASGLKHKDPATRLRAIQILRDADYPDAAAPIGNALGDADDRVQMAAIEAERALFMLHPVSRRTKVGFIIEKRTTAGDAAAGQLALKPRPVPPEVLGGLVLALSDSNPRVRTGAIGLAALVTPAACRPERTGCAQVGNALIENINSREPAVRRAAMDALGRQQYSNAVQALMDQYSYYQKGPDAQAAAEALARIGHAASISTFEELLTSSDAQMRRFAVEGLARAGHRDAIPALQQMGQSERSTSVLLALHFANLALDVPGSSVVEIVAAARDAELRPLAAQYLLDLAPGQAPALSESLRDPDPGTRRLVADILGFSRNAGIAPALTEATKDSDPDVAQAAERALERLKL